MRTLPLTYRSHSAQPLAVAAFSQYFKQRFAPLFKRVPLSCAAEMEGDDVSGLDRFSRSYVAPCMRPPAELEAESPDVFRLPPPFDELACLSPPPDMESADDASEAAYEQRSALRSDDTLEDGD